MERVNVEGEIAKLLGSWKMVPMEAMNEDGSVKGDYFDQKLPPGFRFEPSDKELMTLLWKKINNENMPLHKIREANVYASSPQELTREHVLNREHEWYFFSSRNRKYPNGSRPDRAAGNGYWRLIGSERPITTNRNQVGTKTFLDYYAGIPKKSTRTDWKMHEFVFKDATVPPQRNKRTRNGDIKKSTRTDWKMHEFAFKDATVPPQQNKRTRNGDIKLNDWVLCRIYKSNRSGSNDNITAETNPHVATNIESQNNADVLQASRPTSDQHVDNITNDINSTYQNGQNSMTASNIFNGNDNLLSELDSLTFNIEEIARILDGDDQGINHPLRTDETLIPWKAPDNGWIKLNLNVCKNINGGQTQAACGGVFRDPRGQWLLGYILTLSSDLSPSPGLSPSRVELADLWILLTGLQLAWDRGLKNLCVESDSVTLMELLKNACPPNHHGPMVVNRVKELMTRKEWQVRFELISEKANKVAQSVVGYGLGLHMVQGVQVLQDPPNDCLGALSFDMMSLPLAFELMD